MYMERSSEKSWYENIQMIDIEQPDQLLDYLGRTGKINSRDQVTVEILAGGVSNRTVLLRKNPGPSWVFKQALEKLRVQADWYSSPRRIEREAKGMAWLAHLTPEGSIPRLIFEDFENHLLCMEAVPQPHDNWKTLLLEGIIKRDQVEQFSRLLACIHRKSTLEAHQLESIFIDRSFFETLRLEPYYSYTSNLIPDTRPFYDRLINSTLQNRVCLVHGDYSPKNILVHHGQLILLDHEVIHWGDPAFDIGFALTHLLSKARHLPVFRSQFMEAGKQFWSIYWESLEDVPWKTNLESQAINHTLGCLLARVAGRSPLEYLSPSERLEQQETVLKLIKKTPETIPDLIQQTVRKFE